MVGVLEGSVISWRSTGRLQSLRPGSVSPAHRRNSENSFLTMTEQENQEDLHMHDLQPTADGASVDRNAGQYMYDKTGYVNVCVCGEAFGDHKSWKSHHQKKHRTLKLVYCCNRCKKSGFTSIASVSVHFAKCKPTQPEQPVPVAKEFTCEHCDASYDTKSGLGLHMKSKHPIEFDSGKVIERRHRVWTDEDLYVLAKREAELGTNHPSVNQTLSGIIGCTIDVVKGQRKKPAYRALVESLRIGNLGANTITPNRRIAAQQSTPASARLLPSTPMRRLPPTPSVAARDEWKEHFSLLEGKLTDETLSSMANKIVNGEDCVNELNEYAAKNFTKPVKKQTGFVALGDENSTDTSQYRRKKRLKRYARFQQMWKKNKKDVADMIINDNESLSEDCPSADGINSVFGRLFSSPSPADTAPFTTKGTPKDLWKPIALNVSEKFVKDMAISASGPDGFEVKDLKKLDPVTTNFIINYALFSGKMLPTFKILRTILIPKTIDDRGNANNWRPITISSVFVRLLHKILSRRIGEACNLNKRQRAFVPVDGCFENVYLLDHMIAQSRKLRRKLFLVGIDLSKAFDSVSHHTIRRALQRHNVDVKTVSYIMNSYEGCETIIACGKNSVPGVKMTRGVKQGDPFSPILFNLVIDELLDDLPEELDRRVQMQ